MSKYTLKIDDIVLEFFEETRFLGVMTSLKNYQFCWKLNSSLGMSFSLNTDIEVLLKRKGRYYHFNVYEFKEPTNFKCHYLYTNSFEGEYLLPELKNFDFIWLLKNEPVSNEFIHDIKTWLQDIKEVQLVTEISIDKIKNKASLIF